ncbi:hypothetical protein JL49_17165 [Pseudoalteromonas luteoviolacea]|uniref:Uncharacterized protein n=1 Tax=Pseudoalteromonas luteoviolacea DSM 6061 TaxID=1365250 RepID=A0A166X8R2_9GAMM|nr:hypothetical protein [Pseudoalteromonas luteoviolacea]KZN39810.1 hypothetical protein N475_13705 [Pseudoalteromonas luteoviolacea DSM 6061]KZW99483.1 hypothetical protein JL49_17165 [Pseudoalteromonas luteoviolacea]MBE0385747.1 hypothetical protein [Pseudoalteromonas luteoviolacea DSM 6061]
MTINKEAWDVITEHLAGLFPTVEFQLGSYIIKVKRSFPTESTSTLAVYIDDFIKGEWIHNTENRPTCIESVWKKKTRAYYTPKQVKRLEKDFGKRDAKKYFPNLHNKYEYLHPYFSTSNVLVNQFKKIEGLKLLSIDCESYEEYVSHHA